MLLPEQIKDCKPRYDNVLIHIGETDYTTTSGIQVITKKAPTIATVMAVAENIDYVFPGDEVMYNRHGLKDFGMADYFMINVHELFAKVTRD